MDPSQLQVSDPLRVFQTKKFKVSFPFRTLNCKFITLQLVIHITAIRNKATGCFPNQGINIKNINLRWHELTPLKPNMVHVVLTGSSSNSFSSSRLLHCRSILLECQAMGRTLQTSPANMVIGARPTNITCVLLPFWRFWPAASAQVKTPTGMLSGMAWMTSLWSFRAFAKDTRRLVFTIVSTVLLETSESKRPTSAHMWCRLLGIPAQCAKCGSELSFFPVSGGLIALLFPCGIQENLWNLLHILFLG